MRKELIPFTILALLLPSACLAFPKDFSGPFVAGMIGGNFSTVGADAFSAAGTGFPTGTSTNTGGGIEGGAMAGYLHKMSESVPIHLGIMVGTTLSSTSGTERTTSSSGGMTLSAKHKHRRPHAFQGAALIGYPVSNTIMPFALLGWENALWKHTVTTTSPTAARAKSDKRQNALLAGGGVLKKITQQASVGAMYQGAFHFDDQRSKGGGVSAKHESAQNHKFLALVMYTFK